MPAEVTKSELPPTQSTPPPTPEIKENSVSSPSDTPAQSKDASVQSKDTPVPSITTSSKLVGEKRPLNTIEEKESSHKKKKRVSFSSTCKDTNGSENAKKDEENKTARIRKCLADMNALIIQNHSEFLGMYSRVNKILEGKE